MDCLTIKWLPCSVCGRVAFHHAGWYLVMENRWLDRLKILSWHPSLAKQEQVRSACSREHLKVLIAYWLEEATLRLSSPSYRPPLPLAGDGDRSEAELEPQSMGRLLAELSVYREPLSGNWAGSPEALECILDAMIPEPVVESQPARKPLRAFDPQPGCAPRLVLH